MNLNSFLTMLLKKLVDFNSARSQIIFDYILQKMSKTNFKSFQNLRSCTTWSIRPFTGKVFPLLSVTSTSTVSTVLSLSFDSVTSGRFLIKVWTLTFSVPLARLTYMFLIKEIVVCHTRLKWNQMQFVEDLLSWILK